MKKLLKVFALVTMLVLVGQAKAQIHGSLFLGGALPMEHYASFEDFNNFALTSTDVDADFAGAGTGFTAGFRWYFNVGVKGLDVLLSVDGIYNGPCSDLKNTYRDMESSFEGPLVDYSFKYNSTPKYINVPAMLGLKYTYNFNSSLGVFIEAGAGGNARFITEMESVSQSKLAGIDTRITTIQKYEKAFSFAYQAGIGIEVSKNLMIGCSFYDLGGAAVSGEQTVKTKTLNDNVTNTANDFHDYGYVHPVMVLGRIGFSF